MYENVDPTYYQIKNPDGPTHPGSEDWSHAPVPGWGENPLLAGPATLGDDRSAMVKAMKEAAKDVVWRNSPVPPPFVPYPVHRAVPAVHFNEVTSQSTAPWGRFSGGRAYEGVGAYYAEAPLRDVSGLGSMPKLTPEMIAAIQAKKAASDAAAPVATDPMVSPGKGSAAAGMALGGMVLAMVVGIPVVLGGLGYWVGGKIAPTPASKKTYQWGGAISNIAFPVLGPMVLAVVAAAKSDVRENPRRKRSRRGKRRSRRR